MIDFIYIFIGIDLLINMLLPIKIENSMTSFSLQASPHVDLHSFSCLKQLALCNHFISLSFTFIYFALQTFISTLTFTLYTCRFLVHSLPCKQGVFISHFTLILIYFKTVQCNSLFSNIWRDILQSKLPSENNWWKNDKIRGMEELF